MSYTCRDPHTGDDIKNINMSWENQPLTEIMQNINVWLSSIGQELEVVNKSKIQKNEKMK